MNKLYVYAMLVAVSIGTSLWFSASASAQAMSVLGEWAFTFSNGRFLNQSVEHNFADLGMGVVTVEFSALPRISATKELYTGNVKAIAGWSPGLQPYPLSFVEMSCTPKTTASDCDIKVVVNWKGGLIYDLRWEMEGNVTVSGGKMLGSEMGLYYEQGRKDPSIRFYTDIHATKK